MMNQTPSPVVRGRRVVITGAGVITSIGLNLDAFWRALTEGHLGIGLLEGMDPAVPDVRVAAQVRDFDPLRYMDRKEARRMDRYCQFAVAAAAEAMQRSRLDVAAYGAYRVGTIIGSGVGGLDTMAVEFRKLYLNGGPGRVSPLFIPMMIANMAAGKVSMIHGTKGSNFCVTTACASGSHALGEAFRAIKYGHLDACIAGGAEAPVTPVALAGFTNMKALSSATDPAAASIPFDARRDGFVIGEGAGIVILEELEHALARGADILCELAGYGATADAYHITSPDPEGEGAAEAMCLAMDEAGVAPEDIGYINAHGTGTPLNDKYETLAIKKAMAGSANSVRISSTKSMTGHLLGAAGAVEAIAVGLALRDGLIPPTIGLEVPDPECDLDYVPGRAVHQQISAALNNSLGFGGHNATLCLKKMEV
ncbi:MAG: beta-ketoacyl-ACP synthase II [Clostridiaceae bacterium]|nr:beta-ketoacyl-ACP synthase II [Clostridiaceae bacterium]